MVGVSVEAVVVVPVVTVTSDFGSFENNIELDMLICEIRDACKCGILLVQSKKQFLSYRHMYCAFFRLL